MEIKEVVLLRDTIRCGKNLPVRVCIDNCFTIIDESNPTQFTIWDDENGILYSFRLVDVQGDTSPSNKQQAVSLFAVNYTSIQAIEVPLLPVDDIATAITNIRNTGKAVSKEFEERIIKSYKGLLSGNLVDLTHEDINRLTGSNLNTADDYFAGRFTQSFKETLPTHDRNKYVDELNAKNNTETN